MRRKERITMMTGSTIKKRTLMALAAFFAACCLLMSCVRPAYANVDPTWEEEETVIPEQTPEETPPEDVVSEPEETEPEETEPEETEPEQGFTTPGNGDLGDEIKNSTGKDFYTIRTKNNNTFYMVIDHSNSTENVYMLSLVDENDLAEFMDQTEKETEAEVTPAVIIPETTPVPVETEAPKQPEPEVEEPETKSPLENNTILILGAGALIFILLYYFKIYKPSHEEEDDDDEGIEMGDGLPTEHEE